MSLPLSEPPSPAPDAPHEAHVPPATIHAVPQRPARFTGPRSRRATYAVLVLIGIQLGLIGAFLSVQVLHVGDVGLPIGPLVAVAANLFFGLWAAGITGNRSAGVAPAVGWLGTVLLLSTSRPEGDLVITNSGRGVAFLLLGALAWAAAAVGSRLVVPAQPS